MEFIIGIKLHHAASSSLDFFQKRNRKHCISWVLFVWPNALSCTCEFKASSLTMSIVYSFPPTPLENTCSKTEKSTWKMNTGLKLSSQEATNGCKLKKNSDRHLRQFPRLLLFSPFILSKRHLKETAGKSFTSNCERADSSGFQTHCGGGIEAHTAIIVAGRDYLLQDNERLNYRREQSFLRNIKRLPVRSEELSRRNRFLPPPRGKSRTICTYKTSALCTEQDHQRQFHTERLLSSPRTSFTICINGG